jgi:hypothetical protein
LTLNHYGIMMPCMRTTLTIDPDVGKLLEQEVQRSRKPFKQVVNEALRRGLTRSPQRTSKVVLKVHDSRILPGYDPSSFNSLADELEDAELLGKAAKAP